MNKDEKKAEKKILKCKEKENREEGAYMDDLVSRAGDETLAEEEAEDLLID